MPISVVTTLAAVFLVVLIVRWQKQKKSEENKPDRAMHPVATRSTIAHA